MTLNASATRQAIASSAARAICPGRTAGIRPEITPFASGFHHVAPAPASAGKTPPAAGVPHVAGERGRDEGTLGSVRIQSLDHLVLTVADVKATVAFYEKLGMREETFGEDRVTLRFGDQKINVHQRGGELSPNAAVATPGSADLCFLVADSVDDVLRALEDAGIDVELGPVSRTGATGPLSSIYIRDPDGNLVELSRASH